MPPPTKPDLQLDNSYLFDALIIGAGPAGLSAALALCRVNRKSVVFSNSVFRNERAHHAHTILSRDHTPPSEVRRIAREQVEAYGTVRFIERAVTKAQKENEDGLFEVLDEAGGKWKGKKIVLAMGVKDILPTAIPGYAENWGHNIYQCLFCDGIERSDQAAGTLGFDNPMVLHNINIMRQLGCPKVTIFSNGPLKPQDEATAHALEIAKARGVTIDERRIAELINIEDHAMDILFTDGSNTRVGFLAHRPSTQLIAPELAQQLGVDIVPDGAGGQMLKRNEPFGETNIKGVFAAGDAGTLFRQVASAMTQGNAAGGGAQFSISLDEEREVEEQMKGALHGV